VSWNFCPWCGHRTFKHTSSGCIESEERLVECTDPACNPTDVLLTPGAKHGHMRPIPCECKHPYSQMMEQAG
jgi:hypothetical protein